MDVSTQSPSTGSRKSSTSDSNGASNGTIRSQITDLQDKGALSVRKTEKARATELAALTVKGLGDVLKAHDIANRGALRSSNRRKFEKTAIEAERAKGLIDDPSVPSKQKEKEEIAEAAPEAPTASTSVMARPTKPEDPVLFRRNVTRAMVSCLLRSDMDAAVAMASSKSKLSAPLRKASQMLRDLLVRREEQREEGDQRSGQDILKEQLREFLHGKVLQGHVFTRDQAKVWHRGITTVANGVQAGAPSFREAGDIRRVILGSGREDLDSFSYGAYDHQDEVEREMDKGQAARKELHKAQVNELDELFASVGERKERPLPEVGEQYNALVCGFARRGSDNSVSGIRLTIDGRDAFMPLSACGFGRKANESEDAYIAALEGRFGKGNEGPVRVTQVEITDERGQPLRRPRIICSVLPVRPKKETGEPKGDPQRKIFAVHGPYLDEIIDFVRSGANRETLTRLGGLKTASIYSRARTRLFAPKEIDEIKAFIGGLLEGKNLPEKVEKARDGLTGMVRDVRKSVEVVNRSRLSVVPVACMCPEHWRLHTRDSRITTGAAGKRVSYAVGELMLSAVPDGHAQRAKAQELAALSGKILASRCAAIAQSKAKAVLTDDGGAGLTQGEELGKLHAICGLTDARATFYWWIDEVSEAESVAADRAFDAEKAARA